MIVFVFQARTITKASMPKHSSIRVPSTYNSMTRASIPKPYRCLCFKKAGLLEPMKFCRVFMKACKRFWEERAALKLKLKLLLLLLLLPLPLGTQTPTICGLCGALLTERWSVAFFWIAIFFPFFPHPPPDLLVTQRVDDFESHPAKLNGNLCSGRVAECQFRTLSALGELDGFSEKVLRSGLPSLVFLCFL